MSNLRLNFTETTTEFSILSSNSVEKNLFVTVLEIVVCQGASRFGMMPRCWVRLMRTCKNICLFLVRQNFWLEYLGKTIQDIPSESFAPYIFFEASLKYQILSNPTLAVADLIKKFPQNLKPITSAFPNMDKKEVITKLISRRKAMEEESAEEW